MDARLKASDLLRRFGETIGVEALGLDAEGTAVVTFDDLFVLFFVPDREAALRIATALPESEGAKSASLLEDLLIANAHGGTTNGATIAVDGPAGPVLLQHRLPLTDLPYHEFEEALAGFVEAASALAARVQVARSQALRSHEAEPLEAVGDMIMFKA